VEELVEIGSAAVACGVKKIRLTGGEPLVRRGILDICRGLRAIPGLDELCLTTNGSLLPGLASPLREAGVDRLNISLDTLRPDRFASMTRRGQLSDVLDGIAAAEAAGFTDLKLDTVLIGGFNDDEVGDFLNLTLDRPWEVRFIELMPMGPCAAWDKSCFLPGETILKRFPDLRPIGTEGVARRYRLPGARGAVGLISPVSHEFCGDCRRVRVTADGKLKGCLHSREELSLRGLHGPELENAIRQGIYHKPPRHHLEERPSDTLRTMNQIGG
jgi:cyclic pyranopterin phosphate synthase